MRPRSIFPVILCALMVSACGSSAKIVTGTAGQAGSASSTKSALTKVSPGSDSLSATTSSASGGAGVSTTAAGPPLRCQTSDLHGSSLGRQGAAGHGELGFALRNVSSHTCHIFGFPGVQFLSPTGGPLSTHSSRTTHDVFGSTPLAGFELPAGATTSFRLGVSHGLASSAGCATAAALAVIAPDDTVSLRITIPDGAYECGSATVSPLRPGSSAFP